ncbi:type VI secretion system contractile sheath small subunit, partial [Neisseria sp. P0015.S010]
MDYFSPAAISKKVAPLNELLQARTEISNLISYMVGKSGAEELIGKFLGDSELL